MPKIWLKPKEYYDKSIIIKMTCTQFENLKFGSKKLHMSQSELVRNALNEYLCKHLWYNVHKLNLNLISQERR